MQKFKEKTVMQILELKKQGLNSGEIQRIVRVGRTLVKAAYSGNYTASPTIYGTTKEIKEGNVFEHYGYIPSRVVKGSSKKLPYIDLKGWSVKEKRVWSQDKGRVIRAIQIDKKHYPYRPDDSSDWYPLVSNPVKSAEAVCIYLEGNRYLYRVLDSFKSVRGHMVIQDLADKVSLRQIIKDYRIGIEHIKRIRNDRKERLGGRGWALLRRPEFKGTNSPFIIEEKKTPADKSLWPELDIAFYTNKLKKTKSFATHVIDEHRQYWTQDRRTIQIRQEDIPFDEAEKNYYLGGLDRSRIRGYPDNEKAERL